MLLVLSIYAFSYRLIDFHLHDFVTNGINYVVALL